jgi:uncharacterized protein
MKELKAMTTLREAADEFLAQPRIAVADAIAAGVPRVWMHHGIGPGSDSEAAAANCREHGVRVIPGGCPCMFGATSDPGHRCMKVMLRAGGKLPRTVD